MHQGLRRRSAAGMSSGGTSQVEVAFIKVPEHEAEGVDSGLQGEVWKASQVDGTLDGLTVKHERDGNLGVRQVLCICTQHAPQCAHAQKLWICAGFGTVLSVPFVLPPAVQAEVSSAMHVIA